jgi:hypothetical protein
MCAFCGDPKPPQRPPAFHPPVHTTRSIRCYLSVEHEPASAVTPRIILVTPDITPCIRGNRDIHLSHRLFLGSRILQTAFHISFQIQCACPWWNLYKMDFIRNRLSAPRQAKLARAARQNGASTVAESYKPSRMTQLAREAPAWYRSSARRRLYGLLFSAAVISYATSGYDGSMMNSFQTVAWWDDFFGGPRGSTFGLISAMMSLDSICSTPIAPYVADRWGR